MNKELNQEQIKNIIRRRKKGFILIFLVVFLAGFIVALALPPIYRSEAILNIEDQEIKEGFEQLATRGYAEERIGKIEQQLLTRPRLMEIIEKFDLHIKDNDQINISEMVGQLHKNIKLRSIVSEMKSKPGGQVLSFTHAFKLSYEGEDPEIVQNVTSTLADIIIQEDIKSTEKILSATTDFLNAELERLKYEIENQEKKISEFKEKHSRKLPSDLSYNIQSVTRMERSLDQADMRLRNLYENMIFIQSQLAQVEPLSPVVLEGDKIAINPNQRLKELNLQLIKLKSIYSDKHPDIRKLQGEIRELEAQVKTSDISVEKVKRLRQLENELTILEGQVGPKHPDVRALKKEISILSKEVQNLMTESVKLKISEEKPDNPAYINLKTRISAIKNEIKAIEQDKKKIIESIEVFQKRIENTPSVENELNILTRDYDAIKAKYNQIWDKLTTAQVAMKVESKQGGRRFSIASPANLPTEPYKPNRLAIILLSFVVALGTSFMSEALKESMDNSVRSTEQLRQITNVPVLSSISYILTDNEKKIRRSKVFGLIFLIISTIFTGLYFTNKYFNLEELLSILLERLKMIA